MNAPRWLKRWLGWEAMMFRQIERRIELNTKATLALAASISAIGLAVADVAKAIAAHPATQADDSGDILKAAEELQGFATQLEGVATTVNGGAPVATTGSGDGTTTGSGDGSGGTTAAAGDGSTGTGEAPAPEAGSEAGPGALEATPALVEDPAASGDQTVTS